MTAQALQDQINRLITTGQLNRSSEIAVGKETVCTASPGKTSNGQSILKIETTAPETWAEWTDPKPPAKASLSPS